MKNKKKDEYIHNKLIYHILIILTIFMVLTATVHLGLFQGRWKCIQTEKINVTECINNECNHYIKEKCVLEVWTRTASKPFYPLDEEK